jgi:hypothetical protein
MNCNVYDSSLQRIAMSMAAAYNELQCVCHIRAHKQDLKICKKYEKFIVDKEYMNKISTTTLV